MRLAFLANNYAGIGHYTSGVGNYLARLVPLLAARGHECEVFCNAEGLGVSRRVTETHGGALVHIVPDTDESMAALSELPAGTPWSPLGPAWRLASVANERHRQLPFDAVQVTNFQPAALFLDISAPIVMRMSSYSPAWRAAEQHGARNPGFPLTWHLEFLLEREAIAACDAWCAPSQTLCDLYREALLLDVTLLRPPAHAELPREAWDDAWYRAATGRQTPYLAFASAINRRKGAHILAAALPRFLAACPEAHVHLVGQGLDCLDLVCAADPDPRHPRVHYHGTADHGRVYPLLAGAAGLVLPSLVDNLPNTMVEALTLGTPVIVARGSSADEVVAPGNGGFVVPPADVDALADAMIQLLRMSPVERDAIGRRGAEAIRHLLDPERAVLAFERFLDTVTSQPVKPRPHPHQRLHSVAASLRDLCTIAGIALSERQKREAFAPLVVSLVRDGIANTAVYGAGESGQLLARELTLHGIAVSCYIDSKAELWGTELFGTPVISLDEAMQRREPVVAVGSIAFRDEIAARISDAGAQGWRPRLYLPAPSAAGRSVRAA